jgi:hypothetical protein
VLVQLGPDRFPVLVDSWAGDSQCPSDRPKRQPLGPQSQDLRSARKCAEANPAAVAQQVPFEADAPGAMRILRHYEQYSHAPLRQVVCHIFDAARSGRIYSFAANRNELLCPALRDVRSLLWQRTMAAMNW